MSLDGYNHDHRRGAHPLKQSEHEHHMHSGAAMRSEGEGMRAALAELDGDALAHSQRQPNIGPEKTSATPDRGFYKGKK